MSEFGRVVLGLFAAFAPFGALPALTAVGEGRERLRVTLVLLALGLCLVVVAVAVDGPFLDWIEVSPESFQVAAGITMLPLALRLLWSGRSATALDAGRPLFWLAASLLPAPVVFVAALGYGARFDDGTVLLAGLLVVALAGAVLQAGGLLRALGASGAPVLGRASGALLVVVAVELIIHGVQSV